MEIYLVARWSDGSVSHEAMQLAGRFPAQPAETGWRFAGDGTWVRASSDANINQYLGRVAQRRLELDGLTLVGWRRITAQEHAMFERDRTYRDAMADDGVTLSHDMTKARELHRAFIRHQNGDRFMTLDREWVDASASGDTAKAQQIAAQRDALRNFVNDPRIDAAQTLDELKVVVPDARQ